jgi:uncharacterized protein (DUF58 family)
MPEWNEGEVARALNRVRLSMDPRRRRQGLGNRLGASHGSSLEFHDYRNYVAGDDLRHLDWGVYARSDQLVLRRHRQEVSPRVEIVLDLSLSMAVVSDKLRLACGLAALFAGLAEVDGLRPQMWTVSDKAQRIGAAGSGAWRAELKAAVAKGAAGLEQRAPAFNIGSERIIISDGLCPSGGAAVVRSFGAGAGRLCLVQVLCREECAPAPLGAVRLEDVEGGASDLIHDEAACQDYRSRFARHQQEWQQALAGRGAGLIPCAVEDGFQSALNALLTAGVVEVS